MLPRLSFDLEQFPSDKRERLQLRLSELLLTAEECINLANGIADVEENSVRTLRRINEEASALLHRLSS